MNEATVAISQTAQKTAPRITGTGRFIEVAEQERARAEQLAARLRELGVDPDTLS